MLDTGVLVLNKVYQPIHVTSVRRAFSLLYAGAARAIDEQFQLFDFESWSALSAASHDSIGTINRRIRVPRVIVLLAYERLPRSRVRFSRFNIYARDDNTCQYCGRKLQRTALNLDHVVPRAQGGRTTWENVVTACGDCNLRKGSRLPRECAMFPRNSPRQPTTWELQDNGRGFPPNYLHESWRDFLYWDSELES